MECVRHIEDRRRELHTIELSAVEGALGKVSQKVKSKLLAAYSNMKP